MKFCLIGEKLSHSKSKEIHEFFGQSYDIVELAPEEVEGFVKDNPYDGFNVTIPYKKTVMPFLDELGESAKKIGSVNTVVKEDGKLIGYNTDFFGMNYMLEKADISLQGKRILILGSGGTSETAYAVCVSAGAKSVEKVSRTGEINYCNCYEKTLTQGIINTTPVGMFPRIDECPISPERFPDLEFVADCIYNPYETVLVKRSIDKGIKGVNGLYMLAAQALKA